MDIIICTRRISGCVKEKYIGRSEERLLEYKIVEEFLADIRKEFRGGNEELVKVVELKKLEQGRRTIEEFV